MPLFTLRTTVARVPEAFFAETATLIGNLMSKPSEKVLITVFPGVQMSMGGSPRPYAHVSLQSIGKVSRDENLTYVKPICEHVHKHFGVDKNDVFIEFHDLVPHMLASGGELKG